MSRYIKVSTMAMSRFSVDQGIDSRDILKKSISYLENKMRQVLPDKPDLIVFPEVCDTPSNLSYTKRIEYYNIRKDCVLSYFQQKAKENRCNIVYPYIRLLADGSARNTSVVINRSGKVIGKYDKNHPTIDEMDQDHVTCGHNAPLIECDFGSIGCIICFDLNFDDLRNKYMKKKPDIIVFSSLFHGGILQQGWAHSCGCFFVSSVSDHESGIISPLGQKVVSSTNYTDHATEIINLDHCIVHLDNNSSKLRAAKEKYGSMIKITDPGLIGKVMISSESDAFSAKDVLHEYNILTADEYFDNSQKRSKLNKLNKNNK